MHSAPIIVGGGVIGGESDQNQEEYPSPTSSEEATTTTTKDSNPTLTENISKSKKQEGLSKLNQEGLSKLNYTHLTKSTPNLPYSAPTHLHLDSTHLNSAGILSAGSKNGFAFANNNISNNGCADEPPKPPPIDRTASQKSLNTLGSISSGQTYSDASSMVIDEINRQKWRNRHVHRHFSGDLPAEEICIADFSCALEKKGLLRQGRLYFTQQFICFHSPIGPTKLIIHVADIQRVLPKMQVMLPTSIQVELVDESRLLFCSFIFRGNALKSFGVLMLGWNHQLQHKQKVQNLLDGRNCSSSDDSNTHSGFDSSESSFSEDSSVHEETSDGLVMDPSSLQDEAPTSLPRSTPLQTQPDNPDLPILALPSSSLDKSPLKKMKKTKKKSHCAKQEEEVGLISFHQTVLLSAVLFLALVLFGFNAIMFVKSTSLLIPHQHNIMVSI